MLLVVAFPERFLPVPKKRTEKVGCTSWGVYAGVNTEELDNETVEAEVPSRGPGVVAGSNMYALGRGVSFRR